MAFATSELAAHAWLSHTRQSFGGSCKKSRPAELVEFVNEALATPPELAAQTLISLADSALIADEAWKQELLEQAFYLAGKAKHPLPMRQLEGTETDTRTGMLSKALSLGIDTLTLRSAVLRCLVRVNPIRAKELLIETLPLKVAPVSCEQAMRIGDLDDFYLAASTIIQKGFTTQERDRGLQDELIERLIAEATHPLQIKSVMLVYRSVVQVTSQERKPPVPMGMDQYERFQVQRARALVHWQDAMRNSEVDARSFALTGSANDFVVEFGRLLSNQRLMKQPLAELLLSGRQWLARQFTQHTCQPATRRNQPNALPTALENYNGFLTLSERPIDPFTVAEFQSVTPKQAAVTHRYWRTPQTQALLVALKSLRFGPMEKQLEQIKAGKNPPPLTLAERDTLDWQRQLNEFLQSMEKWKPEDEASSLDYFHQRCITYGALIELTPVGSMRERLLGEYLNFLQAQRWQQESFIEWFWHVEQLPKRDEAASQRWVYEAYANARDNVLQLLTKRDKLLGTRTSPQK